MEMPKNFTTICLAISKNEDAVLMIDGRVLAVIQLLGRARTKVRVCAPREIRVIRERIEDSNAKENSQENC